MAGRSSMAALVAILVAGLIALSTGPTAVDAAALTVNLQPGERSCYHAWVDQAGEKVGWYFAVQTGGHFEIDWSVTSPSNKLITDGIKERQADIVFTGQEVGEYTFCLEDPSFSGEKMVDFDITVESEPRLPAPLGQASMLSEHSAPLEESISAVNEQLTDMGRTQRYFRTWENRGYDLVRSTQSKLFWFSVTETILIIGISVGQVSLIRWLFEAKGTTRFRV